LPYEKNWRKEIESKIKAAVKVQSRWIDLSDEEWDKELDIIKELNPKEFLDFIKADFGLSYMLKFATHHPKLAVRQLFGLVKGMGK
jgi:digeranylgeranylglycerophospholipid reductase